MRRGDQVKESKAPMAETPQRLYTLKQAGVYIGLSHWRMCEWVAESSST
jgi:hypothetical protein